jgi:choline transporter-like protein 2/4/5
MRKQQKHEGPTGAIVSGTPVYGSPVIGSPVVTGSPAATAMLSSDPGTAAPEDDAPAATPTRELPSAPPLYEASAPPYAGSPPAAYASSVLHIDREAVAGPPAAKKPHIKLQNRKCQDIVFLILFIAFGIGFMIESSFGFNKGEPRRYFLFLLPQFETKPQQHGQHPKLEVHDDLHLVHLPHMYSSWR